MLETLLAQGLILFPKAEKGAFFILDSHKNVFLLAAVIGYDALALQDTGFDYNLIIDRYTKNAELLKHGVYLLKGPTLPGLAENLPPPKSLLAMTITLDEKFAGFLILANFQDTEAFDSSDVQRLVRFREHAVSAVTKARILQELQEKIPKSSIPRRN